jgi:hypothetical protein
MFFCYVLIAGYIMLLYFKRKAPDANDANNPQNSCLDDINLEEEIKYDPGLRKQIDDYHPNLRECEKEVLGE